MDDTRLRRQAANIPYAVNCYERDQTWDARVMPITPGWSPVWGRHPTIARGTPVVIADRSGIVANQLGWQVQVIPRNQRPDTVRTEFINRAVDYHSSKKIKTIKYSKPRNPNAEFNRCDVVVSNDARIFDKIEYKYWSTKHNRICTMTKDRMFENGEIISYDIIYHDPRRYKDFGYGWAAFPWLCDDNAPIVDDLVPVPPNIGDIVTKVEAHMKCAEGIRTAINAMEGFLEIVSIESIYLCYTDVPHTITLQEIHDHNEALGELDTYSKSNTEFGPDRFYDVDIVPWHKILVPEAAKINPIDGAPEKRRGYYIK